MQTDCPHCRSRIPESASACPGCGAEIDYGPSDAAMLIPLIVAGLCGYLAIVTAGSYWLALAAGALAGLAVACLVKKLADDRIVFRKPKTRASARPAQRQPAARRANWESRLS